MSDLPPVGTPVTLDNWQEWGRYSFQHVEDVLGRVQDIPKRVAPTPLIDQGRRLDPDQIPVPSLGIASPPRTVREIIDDTDTDGCIVLHRGEVVFEEYPPNLPNPAPGQMEFDTEHLLMSVTKPVTATIAGILEHMDSVTAPLEKVLVTSKNVADYVDELQGTDYGGVEVRDVLDMRSDIEFSEAYGAGSHVDQMEAAAGWGRLKSGDPDNVKDFLKRLVLDPNRPSGKPFTYRSCETGVLGWVCEEAYMKAHNRFKPFAELVSELIWSKLGADKDAYITVDRHNTAAFDGGICATLRDLARFGAMICNDGMSLSGNQVVNPVWVKDIFENGDAWAFANNPDGIELGMAEGKFRSMFWSPKRDQFNDEHDVVLCIGVYGQLVYINRHTQTVGVKLSSWPVPKNDPHDPNAPNANWKGASAVSMFEAINAHLHSLEDCRRCAPVLSRASR